MINTDRIVPITAIDLISMYGLILKVGGVSVTAKDATTTDGQFTITTSDNGNEFICSEPVKSVSAGAGVGGYTMYFVPAYDYSGFTFGGTANIVTGDTVIADGRTLYKAVQSNNAVTISKIGF